MKKYLLFIALIILGICSTDSYAQHLHENGVCGTVQNEAMNQQIRDNKALMQNLASFRTGDVIYIPITFHLAAKNDGSSRALETNILAQLCSLNEFYEDQDIQFFMKFGFNYIDNTNVYENHTSLGAEAVINSERKAKSVNVYVLADANGGSTLTGGITLGYYRPPFNGLGDYIIIRKSETNGNSQTLAHEVGHFFSVAHPFSGWDAAPWNETDHGNPVNLPGNNAPNGQTKIEFADGSNCETAGDMLCDTPASYLFFGWPTCNYSGGCMDPNGDLVDPDEYNIMDYFGDNCQPKYFTDDQKALIQADIADRGNSPIVIRQLDIDDTPSAQEITEEVVLVEPADGSTTPANNLVVFDWEPVAGATTYILEIAQNPGFTVFPKRLVVYGHYKVIIDDDYWNPNPNLQYYWRVKPYNSFYGCAPITSNNSFRVGDGVLNANEEISYIKDWSVQPNPVRTNEALTIQMDSDQPFTGQVSLYSITGQLVQDFQHQFQAGSSAVQVPVAKVESGMYIVSIRAEGQVSNKKIVIQNN